MSEGPRRAAEITRRIAALQHPDGDPWAFATAGMRLRSVTPRDVEDDELLDRLGSWRAAHMASYPTQFVVTRAGTRAWLRDVVLGNPGRLMLLVVDGDGTGDVVGHLGFDRADVGEGGLQLSNVVVGAPERMGPGTMRACLAGLLRWGRDALEPTRIWAPVFSDNVRPMRLLRSVGFVDRERTPMRLHVAGERREYRPCAPGDDAPPDRWQQWLDWPLTPAAPFTGVGLGIAAATRAAASTAGPAATLERARERGVRWIDATEAGGRDAAGNDDRHAVEEAAGAVLGGPDRPAVATACGLVRDARTGRTLADDPAGALRGQADASRRRLGVDRLDLLLLHPPQDAGDLEAAWSALATLADEGVAARVGLAGGPLDALERCHAIRPADAFRAPVCLVRPVPVAVAGAHALGVPVLAHGTLENGLLAGGTGGDATDGARGDAPGGVRGGTEGDAPGGEPGHHGRPLLADPARRGPFLSALEDVARDVPCTVAELAVSWALGVPGVAGATVRARRAAQVDGWSSAAGVRLEPAHRAAIDAALAALGAGRP